MLKKWITAAALCVFGLAHAAATDANKASPTELDQVKGIGPATAARIVEQRKSGPFKNWDDFIARVNGIGPASAAKLSSQGLTINGQSYAAAKPAPAAAANAANAKAKPPTNAAAATAPAAAPPTAAKTPKPAKSQPTS